MFLLHDSCHKETWNRTLTVNLHGFLVQCFQVIGRGAPAWEAPSMAEMYPCKNARQKASNVLGTPKPSKNLFGVLMLVQVSGAFCWDTPTLIQITLHHLLRPLHVCAAEWETALWCPGCIFGVVGRWCTVGDQTAKAWACMSRLVEQCRACPFYWSEEW